MSRDTYIPKHHFDNLLREHSIKLTFDQRTRFENIFEELYQKVQESKRNGFFSHAIVYNYIVKNKFPNSSLPLIYTSQNLKNKNKDFNEFIR